MSHWFTLLIKTDYKLHTETRCFTKEIGPCDYYGVLGAFLLRLLACCSADHLHDYSRAHVPVY